MDNNIHHPAPKFTFWVAVSFTLNYVVGSGFLTLPWGFAQTGAILGVLVLSVFAFYAVLSVIFILESSDRAIVLSSKVNTKQSIVARHGYQSILDDTCNENDTNIAVRNGQYDMVEEKDEEENVTVATFNIVTPTADTNNTIEVDDILPHVSLKHERKFEIAELCELFLGVYGKQLYTTFLALYMYGTLWAYGTVFSNSFGSYLPMTFLFGDDLTIAKSQSYYVYLVIFGCIVVPMSLMEFSEQIPVQVALTVFRIVMLFVMVTTISVAYFSGEMQFTDVPVDSFHTSNEVTMHWNRLHLLLPIVAYAFIFHHSVPSLAHPVEDKASLVRIFTIALMISFVAYGLLGTVASLFFGRHVCTSSNLDWENYVGVLNSDGSVPMYARIVTFFVVLFPAVDVASAYPLNAFTLGNNLMSAYFGADMHLHEKSRLKLNIFRACAAVPPLFGAMWIHELSSITQYTGLSGFAVMFIFPALLARASHLKLIAIGEDPKTIHHSFFSSTWCQYLVGGSGILLLLVVGICLIIGHTSST